MKFSKRIMSVKPSETLAVTAKAKELKAQGENVIGFGAGEPDFDTPDNIKKAAIQAIHDNQTHYTPVPGTDALKSAIVDKFKRENNVTYSPQQIVVSCGAKQSFYNLAQVLWEEGDEVIIPAPYWVSYPDMVGLAGATPVIVSTTMDSEFKLTPDQLQAACTPRSRAVVLNSPSNPTGSAYTRAELEALGECALKNGLLIISDEIYEHIIYDNFEHVSIASLSPELQKNTVVINGVSKGYAMTGWRIGYIAAEKDIAAQVVKLQGQLTSGATSISQAASVEALNGPQDDVVRMREEFQKRRNGLMDRLAQIPGVSCYKPVGAFYAFPDFSQHYGKTGRGKRIEGSVDFAEYLLEEAKVALVPGSAFGDDKCARISYATSMEVIGQGLDRIAEAIQKLQ